MRLGAQLLPSSWEELLGGSGAPGRRMLVTADTLLLATDAPLGAAAAAASGDAAAAAAAMAAAEGDSLSAMAAVPVGTVGGAMSAAGDARLDSVSCWAEA